jgi:hypothetical protein
MHDPDSAELRREASRKGGRNRSAKARAAKQVPDVMTADELAGWLSLLFAKVMAGRTEPKVGTAAATIARTLLEAQTVASQPTIEDLQEQLAVLRVMVERGAAGRVA